MTTTTVRSRSPHADTLNAARELAALLAQARAHLGTKTSARVCYDCGHVVDLPSRTDSRRCWKCAIVFRDPPEDNPDEDSSPDTEGPSPL